PRRGGAAGRARAVRQRAHRRADPRALRGRHRARALSMNAPPATPPRISVLVCTRNRGGRIAPCVRSILARPGADMELLVVDQSADEETRRGLEGIRDPRLRYLRTPTRGLARARNVGIRASSGPIVLFTDDDCIAEPDWVGAVIEEYDADPELDAV